MRYYRKVLLDLIILLHFNLQNIYFFTLYIFCILLCVNVTFFC